MRSQNRLQPPYHKQWGKLPPMVIRSYHNPLYGWIDLVWWFTDYIFPLYFTKGVCNSLPCVNGIMLSIMLYQGSIICHTKRHQLSSTPKCSNHLSYQKTPFITLPPKGPFICHTKRLQLSDIPKDSKYYFIPKGWHLFVIPKGPIYLS